MLGFSLSGWLCLVTVALIAVPSGAQVAPHDDLSKERSPQTQKGNAKKTVPTKRQMRMGMLAVLSDRGGNLFVDGEPKVAISPGTVTKLELTAGQHFVAFLDDTHDSVRTLNRDVGFGSALPRRLQFLREAL